MDGEGAKAPPVVVTWAHYEHARRMMRLADVNRNGALSFTELTTMLEQTEYEARNNPTPSPKWRL